MPIILSKNKSQNKKKTPYREVDAETDPNFLRFIEGCVNAVPQRVGLKVFSHDIQKLETLLFGLMN